MEALIHSMTPFERQNPDKITPSRKRRIAAGSGKDIQHVNQLLKQHKQMAKMMKMLSDPSGISKMMKAVQGLTKGMGGGSGGPLFGNKNATADGNPAMGTGQMTPPVFGEMPNMGNMPTGMTDVTPPKFKTKF